MKSVTHSGFFGILHIGVDITHLASAESLKRVVFRVEDAYFEYFIFDMAVAGSDGMSFVQVATPDLQQQHHSLILDEPTIYQVALERVSGLAQM